MGERTQVGSGRPLEAKFGYCRAIRVDNPTSHIFVAGNASTSGDGSVHAPGDYYEQTKHILGLIKGYVEQAGGSLENVVRTRVFVVDVQNHAEEVGIAHGEVFGEIKPVCTLLGTDALVHPGHGGGDRCGCGDLGEALPPSLRGGQARDLPLRGIGRARGGRRGCRGGGGSGSA